MTFVLADRVKESCTSPGTGTATLLGAATGYRTFSSGIGANNTTFYVIADQAGNNWEVGLGTIGAGGTTLARTTVLSSSNSGSLTNFSSGTQDVWCDYPATQAVYQNATTLEATAGELVASNGIFVNNLTVNTSYSIPSGYSGHSVGPVSVASGKTVTIPSGSRWVVL